MKRLMLLAFLLLVGVIGCNCAGTNPQPQEYDTTPEHEGEDWQGGEYPREGESH